jgi:predicted transcriptional regulator
MYFNRNKSVSLIYHGSNVSITTAYVWLNELKKSGLIEKQPIKRTKSKRFNITDKGKKLIETIEGIWNEY